MASSVMPIEVSALSDVHTDEASLTVTLADGRVISTPLEWYPRLAHATSEERANWRSIDDGEAIHWPDLDEHISVEGLIAGRKSGESGPSLKRWMIVQEKLRQTPANYRALRREAIALGPISAEQIRRRIDTSVLTEDCNPAEWTVSVSCDPFQLLKQDGISEELAIAAYVYEAESSQAALDVRRGCMERGMAERLSGDEGNAVYVAVYSQEAGRRWTSSTL
jgi:hypothetical protein